MAKQINKSRIVQLQHNGTEWALRYTSYGSPTDDSNPDIEYRRIGADESHRFLSSDELSGTLQEFLDARDAAHKATEGI